MISVSFVQPISATTFLQKRPRILNGFNISISLLQVYKAWVLHLSTPTSRKDFCFVLIGLFFQFASVTGIKKLKINRFSHHGEKYLNAQFRKFWQLEELATMLITTSDQYSEDFYKPTTTYDE